MKTIVFQVLNCTETTEDLVERVFAASCPRTNKVAPVQGVIDVHIVRKAGDVYIDVYVYSSEVTLTIAQQLSDQFTKHNISVDLYTVEHDLDRHTADLFLRGAERKPLDGLSDLP
jgi:hypothetical protein